MEASSNCLIIVAVQDGRNFTVQDDGPYVTYLEARFNSEVLVSDVVPFDSSLPVFNTELAWELDRKSLHLFRIERAPIKLQCFVENTKTKVKQLVGYTILDIRSAQECKEPKFAWRPLLNSRYRGLSTMRPEVLLSMQLVKGDELTGTTAEEDVHEQYTSLSYSVNHVYDNDLRVKFCGGQLYKIWDNKLHGEDECHCNFSLTVVITSVTNLNNLVKSIVPKTLDNSYHFKFTLFGNSIRTSPFQRLDTGPSRDEKIAYRIAAPDVNTLSVYFRLNPTLLIQLCNDQKEALGELTVSLRDLINSDKSAPSPIIGEYKFVGDDDIFSEEEKVPSLELFVEILPITTNASPSDRAAIKRTRATSPTPEEEPENDAHHQTVNDSDTIQHYCFSIDLRSLKPATSADVPSLESEFFIQYSYCYFGYAKKVKSSRHSLKSKDDKVVFSEGFFAFNFATSMKQLRSTFTNIPLIIELVEKTLDKKKLRGTCTIELGEFAANDDSSEKKITNFKVPVYSIDKENIAELHVVMCLQKLGTLSTFGTSAMFNSCVAANDTDPIANQFESLLVEAAVEVEVWKQQKVAQFVTYLEKKEKEYMEALAAEQQAKLENGILSQKELELKKKEADLLSRMEHLDAEIGNAIQDVRATFESKLRDEQSRSKRLEAEKEDLEKRLHSLTAKLQSPTTKAAAINGRCTLDRANSVPSSVRSASKQRVSSASNVVPRVANNTRLCMRESSTTRPAVTTNGRPQPAAPQQNGTKKSTLGIRTSTATRMPKHEIIKELQKEKNDILKKKLMTENDPMIKKIDAQLKRFRV